MCPRYSCFRVFFSYVYFLGLTEDSISLSLIANPSVAFIPPSNKNKKEWFQPRIITYNKILLISEQPMFLIISICFGTFTFLLNLKVLYQHHNMQDKFNAIKWVRIVWGISLSSYSPSLSFNLFVLLKMIFLTNR